MKKGMVILLMLWIVLTCNFAFSAEIEQAVMNEISENGTASVIVMLKDEKTDSGKLSAFDLGNKKNNFEIKKRMIKNQQEKVLSNLNVKSEDFSEKRKGLVISSFDNQADFELEHRYSTVNGFSGKATKSGIGKLRQDPNVEKVYLSGKVYAFLDSSIPQINANDSWKIMVNSTNLTGKGQTICIIDSGVDFNHTNLGDGWGNKIIGGYNSIKGEECNDNQSACLDDTSSGHGTHIAGIIISNHSTYKGAAPDANIVIIKALDSSGEGEDADVLDGIDWCINNASSFNISVITMSFGNKVAYNIYCDESFTSFRDAINSAVSEGIIVTAAAGNCEEVSCTDGIASPACIQNATPVGGVTLGDEIVFQRGNILDLLAPGNNIYSTEPNDDFGSRTGTSMSTPHVAAAAAIIKQFVKLKNNTDIYPAKIENILNSTGKEIDDTLGTGRNYSRIDLYAAIISMDDSYPYYSFDSDNSSEDVLVNSTVDVSVYWQDHVELNTAMLYHNATSSYVLNSTCPLSGNTDWCNLTINTNGMEGKTVCWKQYANDSAGNLNNTMEEHCFSITLNNTLPNQTSLISPLNNSFVNLINMIWNESYDLNGDTVYYHVLVNGTEACFTTELNCTYNPDDGFYQWNITPYDGYENGTTSESWFYTYDKTNPLFLISSDNSTLTNILPSINGTANDLNNDSIYSNNSFWSWNGNYTNWSLINNTAIADGNYHILITANDSAGNTNSSLFNFTYDSTPPSYSNVGKNTSLVEVNDTVMLYALWSDSLSGLSHYVFSWNNSGNMENDTAQPLILWSNITKKVNATNESTVIWNIYANDTAGNWNNMGNQVFKLGNSPPTKPNITNPSNDSYINETIFINWTASTDDDFDELYYYLMFNETEACFTTDLNCSYIPLQEEKYEIFIIPNDGYQNGTSSDSIFVYYDLTQPIITSISSSSITSSGATLTATTNEDSTCRYSTTNESYFSMSNTFSTTGGTSHSTALSGLSASTSYTYYVRCKDTAGNVMNFSNSTSFTTSSSGGGSSGGSSSSVTSTQSLDYEERNLGTVFAGMTQSLSFYESDIYGITGIELKAKNRIINGKIKVEIGSLPSGTSAPKTKGSVYKYLEITKSNIDDEDIEDLIIRFKVKKSWIESKKYDFNSVKMYRYNNKVWEELDTKRIGIGADYYIYSAESPGLSTFAITAERASITPTGMTSSVEGDTEKEVFEKEKIIESEDLKKEKERMLPKFNPPDLSWINWNWIIMGAAIFIILVFVQAKWNILRVKVGLEPESILALGGKIESANQLINDEDTEEAKKLYLKILKIYNALPEKEKKWIYKDINNLYKKINEKEDL